MSADEREVADAIWTLGDDGILDAIETGVSPGVARAVRTLIAASAVPAEAGAGPLVVDQAWLAKVLDQVGVMSCEPVSLDDIVREVGNAEKRRVEAVRAFDNLGRLREQDHDRALALRDVVLDLAGRLGVPVPGPAVFDSRDRIEALGATLRLAAAAFAPEAGSLTALRSKLDEWLAEDGISPYRRTAFVQVQEWLDAYGTASGDDER